MLTKPNPQFQFHLPCETVSKLQSTRLQQPEIAVPCFTASHGTIISGRAQKTTTSICSRSTLTPTRKPRCSAVCIKATSKSALAQSAPQADADSPGASTAGSSENASFGSKTILPGATVLLNLLLSTSALAVEATHFSDGDLPPWLLYAFLFLPSLVYATFFILREKVTYLKISLHPNFNSFRSCISFSS